VIVRQSAHVTKNEGEKSTMPKLNNDEAVSREREIDAKIIELIYENFPKERAEEIIEHTGIAAADDGEQA
jgi:hypothetical protein